MSNPTHKKILKDLPHVVPITNYLDFKDYLGSIYRYLKTQITPFSYETFSELLGLSRTNIAYLLIKGQRSITEKTAHKIAEHLQLSGATLKYWTLLITYQTTANSQDRETAFDQLLTLKSKTLAKVDHQWTLEFFKEWYHSVIYELTFLPEFKSEVEWIALHLNPKIRPEKVKASLALLEKLGLITYNSEKQRHFPTRERLSTGDEIASMAVLSYHQTMMEMARESLVQVEADLRDISSATMAIPVEKIDEFKHAISAFRKQILAMAEDSQERDTVYQMNIQLFPLSKKVKGS